MIDLSRYLEMLEETEANLIVFKDDEVLFSSDRRGVSPLIEVIDTFGQEKLSGVVTSDRVVGKAAVLLNAYMGSREMYADTQYADRPSPARSSNPVCRQTPPHSYDR